MIHVVGIYSATVLLRELHLRSNAFEVKYPHELINMNRIKVLHVSYNPGFVGSISYDIGKTPNLQDLELSYTSLGDVLPL